MRPVAHAFMALALPALPAQAQALEWARCYNGPGDYQDRAWAVTVDSAGYVYVSGGSELFGGGASAYTTIKYDPVGDTLWVRRFDVLGGGGPLVLDADGNAYVTGAPVTLKYGSGGDLLWTHENDAEFVALAFDPDGNVAAAGTGFGDLRATKLRPDGGVLWEAVFDGPAHFADEGNDMALDSEGHVLVAGQSWGLASQSDGTQWNYATVKLNGATGDTLWARHYNGPASPSDVPTDIAWAVAVDSLDNVYVSGWSDGATRPAECHTIKYGPDGGVVWERRYAGGGACYDLLVAGGALYAVARTGDGDRLLKYDLDGNLVWVRLHAAEVTFETNPPRLAADAEGNVYVMSLATGPTRQDYAVVQYTPDGERAWTYVYPGTGMSTTNRARAIAVDAAANVYVTGGSSGPVCPEPGFDYLTLKLSQEPVAAEPRPGPSGLALEPVRPNPTRGAAVLPYELPRPAHVRLALYDVLGREVAVVVEGWQGAGSYEVAFDGSELPGGVYVARLEAGSLTATRGLAILR